MPDKEADKLQMIAAFEKVDIDKTGKIGIKQLQELMKETATSKSDKEMAEDENMVKMVLEMADLDGDQMLSIEELLVLIGVEGSEEDRIAGFVRVADKGNKGFITADELKSVLEKVGQKSSDKDIKMFFAMADKNGDQKLQTEEVVAFLKDGGKNLQDPKEKAKMMFRLQDTNSDGYIDKSELKKFFSDMQGEEDEDDNMMVNMMMAMMDKDGDGKLNFEEFCAMMEK